MSLPQPRNDRTSGADRSAPTAHGPTGWVYKDCRFIDATTTHRKANGKPIRNAEHRMWELLEAHAGPDRPICWPSIFTIGECLGRRRSTVLVILKEMEADGLVHRVNGRKNKTIGFILLKRLNPGSLAPKTHEEIEAWEARLRAERASKDGPPTVPFFEPASPKSRAETCAPKSARRNKRRYGNQTQRRCR